MAGQGSKLDRELEELLQELRVALPGVQVLFAFLLTLPFASRFPEITGLERGSYFAAVVCTALASILFIGPTSYHRLRFREYDKDRLLRTANRMAITGMVFLAAAIVSSIFLVSDVMFGGPVGGAVAGTIGGVMGWLWFGLPLVRKLSDGR